MKILHVIDSSGVWGAEKMLFALVLEQLNRGHQPLVLSIGKPQEKLKTIEAAMQARNIPHQAFRVRLIPRLGEIKKLIKLIKGVGPDIIHSHGYKGNILLAFLIKLFRTPPVITTMHGWVTVGNGFSKLRIYEWLDSFAIRRLNGVVLVSEKMLDHPRIKVWPKTIKDRVVTIDNGISTTAEMGSEDFEMELRAFRGESKLIGSVGRLSREKGYQFLIPAFAKLLASHEDVKLVIIGAGSYRVELECLIEQYKLEDKVWITGYIENAGAVIGVLDVYVCSSLTEGLPITLLEAMRESVPIVSTAISNIPALLQEGKGGLLVAPSDIDALAVGIATLLNSDSLCESYIAESKQFFSSFYSSEIMSVRYLDFYRSVIEGNLFLGGTK